MTIRPFLILSPLFLLSLGLLLSRSGNALTISGYQKPKKNVTREFTDTIVKITTEKHVFLVGFKQSSILYRLPRPVKANTTEAFLIRHRDQQLPVTAVVDPYTNKIISLRDESL